MYSNNSRSTLKQRLGAMRGRLAKGRKYRAGMKVRQAYGTSRVPYLSKGLPRTLPTSPFPRSQMLKLRYTENIAPITNVAGNLPAYYSYIVNNMFDPNFTGGGHQPFFRDELAAIYNKYMVYGCKYRIDFFDNGNNRDWKIGTMVTSDSAFNPSTTSIFATEEKRGVRTGTFSYQRGKGQMRGYIACNKALGISKEKYRTEDDYSAAMSTGPANPVTLHLIQQPLDGTGNLTTRMTVQLEMYVRVYDPKVVAQS